MNICNNYTELSIYQQEFYNTIYNSINYIVDYSDTNLKISFNNDSIFKTKFNINELLFIKNKTIGKGAYGEIIEYTNSQYNIYFLIKKEKSLTAYNDVPIEKEIAEVLNNSDCNTVKTKYLFNISDNHYYIMAKADGDLKYLLKSLDNSVHQRRIKLMISEQVRKQLYCLYKKKYLYLDFKLNNILYSCNTKKDIAILLGDLGSAIPDKNNKYVCSYPPYEYRHQDGFIDIHINNNNSKYILSWGVGIILLDLINNKLSNKYLDLLYFKYKDLEKMNKDEINKLFKDISKLLESYYNKDVAEYLSLNPFDRPDISKSLYK